jgi:hypothetical protein
VIVFTIVAFIITIAFNADVDAQGGAYATGVLVLITSASVAVTLSALHKNQRKRTIGFAVIALVFIYTTVVNVVERPDGVRIAGLFILGILVVSLVSRVQRSFQLRATSVSFDEVAQQFLDTDSDDYGSLLVISHEPDDSDSPDEYRTKLNEERKDSGIPARAPVLFLEVHPGDSSNFEEDLLVRGVVKYGHRVLQVNSGNVPNTLAAVLLAIRDHSGLVPNIYFEWTEGNPISNMFRFLITGTGEIAPVTREVLRRAEPDRAHRPDVHVS